MTRKHPRGIAVLFFIEMWERFGFYIMMAIFVLYMENEFGWSDSKKGDFYGWFLGSVYFLPLLGGWLGDKFFGQLKTIAIGSVSMIIGYIFLALSSLQQLYFFYLGLMLIAFGTGVFKVNMSVLVGNLYRDQPQLKDAGFNIYYMGVNVGATLGPVVATALYHLFHSYRTSFWAAAIGMSISFFIQRVGRKSLFSADTRHSPQLISHHSATDQQRDSNRSEDKQRIMTLILLFVIIIFFWIAFYQNGFAMTLFAKRSTVISDLLRPEAYQFFNPFFILVLTPVLLSFFGRLRNKNQEPSTPAKIFYGLTIMGIAMLIMMLASLRGGDLDQNIMSPLWLISCYLVITLAEILISPMGQSFVSKVAPRRIQGVMMGMWFGATAVGSFSSGIFGKFYSDFPHHQYYLILAGLLFFAAILILISFKKLKKFAE